MPFEVGVKLALPYLMLVTHFLERYIKQLKLIIATLLLIPTLAANAGIIGIGDFGSSVQIEEYDDLVFTNDSSPLDVN